MVRVRIAISKQDIFVIPINIKRSFNFSKVIHIRILQINTSEIINKIGNNFTIVQITSINSNDRRSILYIYKKKRLFLKKEKKKQDDLRR